MFTGTSIGRLQSDEISAKAYKQQKIKRLELNDRRKTKELAMMMMRMVEGGKHGD